MSDEVDINTLTLEQIMEQAGRDCSCIRRLKAQGVEDPACEGTCSHAKALRELEKRGLVT